MIRLLRLSTLIAAVSIAAPVFAQRELKDIPDPDPEIERRSFQVADGFEVNLYAADPRIAKPIQINFDARGRLWIASSSIYPHIEPGQEANDRILVVEDADGDGLAEKTSIFAEGLLIPTAVEPGDGGAYVANSTELVHFQDIDGDGKADSKRVLLSGFGTEDTHHILHTFRWGMDGMLYFNQSIYIHSHIETPWGVRRLGGGGIWQFRPESLQLEILCRGLVNTWGHHVDDWGQSFATDGAGGEGINYVFPGWVGVTAPGATRIMKGLNPGSPKYCGLEVASGTHLPEEWRGNMITNDFRGHRVCRFVITEDGSGFASREQPEVIKTTHVAFRPIDVKMGPDGAIYIADWYNPIIQHGEVDFRDPRRDHTHGRIWRVTAKGRPLVKRPQLADAEVAKLLDALKAPEYFTRHHAKRMLKERGAKAVLPALERWVAALDRNDPQAVHHRLEGLWTYQSLDVIAPQLLSDVLHASDHRARAAAVRVLSQWRDRIPDAFALVSASAADKHPRVRLEAVRALALFPGIPSVEQALQVLDQPMDANLDFALWQTARDLQNDWLPAVQAGKLTFDNRVDRQIFALKAIGTAAVVPSLVRLLKAGSVPEQSESGVLEVISGHGGPADLRLIFDLALANSAQPDRLPVAVRLLTSLVQAAERRRVRPDGDVSTLDSLFGKDASLDDVAVKAIGYWKLEALRPRLVALATVGEELTPIARSAISALAALGGDASRETLVALTAHDHPLPRRAHAIAALAGVDLPASANVAVNVLSEFKPTDDPTAIFSTFWKEKQGPAEFLKALGDRPLPPDVAKLGIRAARNAGRDLAEAIAALTKAGGLTGTPTALSPEQMDRLLADVKEQGSAARGEVIFRRSDQVCLKCHAVAGAGGQVGPDLGSIGASAQVDYLIDSLLLPNKAIKENYHSVAVETKAGKVITGIKVRQTDDELVLRDAEDREVAISLGDIEVQAPGGSIMPAGLIEGLTRNELVDLVRFLSELGKVGPYAPSQARVARRWQALDPASPGLRDLLLKGPETVVPQSALTSGLLWPPVYTRVSGQLPVAELPTISAPNTREKWSFVRCQLDVTTAGKVQIRLNSAEGLTAYLDEKAIDAAPEIVADLAVGRHTLVFRIDRAARKEDLRLELGDVPDSTIQVQIVNGK